MKPMYYKDDDGKEYKISFSEELQMKNLHAARENTDWLRKTFYAKIILILIILALTIAILFIFFRLDQIDFFTRIAYR